MMPAPAMKPIIEVAVKKAPISQCAGRMPISDSGMGSRIASGTVNDWNQPTTRIGDQHQHHRERDAEVAEDLVGDLPLAVPLQRRRGRRSAAPRWRGARRAPRPAGPARRAAGSARPGSRRPGSPGAGQVAEHVDDGLQVLVHDRLRLGRSATPRPARTSATAGPAGLHAQGQPRARGSRGRPRPGAPAPAPARARDGASSGPRRARRRVRPASRRLRGRDALQRRLLAVHAPARASRCGASSESSTSTTPGVSVEQAAHAACARSSRAACGVGPVDLGHQRVEHGRPGRDLRPP